MTTDLDALVALRAAATPGPWERKGASLTMYFVQAGTPHRRVAEVTTRDNADFIVAACNAVEGLIERVREAEARAIQHHNQLASDALENAANARRERDAAKEQMGNERLAHAVIEHGLKERLAALEAEIRGLADEMETSTGTHLTVVDGKTKKVPLFLGPVVVARIRALLTKGGE